MIEGIIVVDPTNIRVTGADDVANEGRFTRYLLTNRS